MTRLSVRRSRSCGIIRRRCRRHQFGASGVLIATCLAPVAVEAGSGTARTTKVGHAVRARSPVVVAVLLVAWRGDGWHLLMPHVIGEFVATAVAIVCRGRRFWFTFGAAHSNPHALQGQRLCQTQPFVFGLIAGSLRAQRALVDKIRQLTAHRGVKNCDLGLCYRSLAAISHEP